MPTNQDFKIAVFPGDGIGTEITEPCVALVDAAVAKVGGFSVTNDWLEAGAAAYVNTGSALPDPALDASRLCDAILLAAMGDPAIRYPDGTELTPQIDMRFELDLYAGVRPVRTIAGVPQVIADPQNRPIDFVLIRESTEGLFVSLGKGVVENDTIARDHLEITRKGTERVSRFSFDLARQRKKAGHQGRVTLVDKANVFASMAFMRKVFDEVADGYDDIEADHAYVDAMAMRFVQRPWDYDVMVTENMFGDILSDLGAGLMGGLGFAPSADIGDDHAVFQPCHGSAPDIAGQGKANPTAMFLSAAMMLEWLGEKHEFEQAEIAGGLIRQAVDAAFASGDLLPYEIGGQAGTRQITDAVMAGLKQAL